MGRPRKNPVEELESKQPTAVKKGEVRNPKGRPPKVIKNARDKITRAQAIKIFCVECMGFQIGLVKSCPDIRCPLWTFRSGVFEHSDMSIRTKNG
jgi:hypothetical protein